MRVPRWLGAKVLHQCRQHPTLTIEQAVAIVYAQEETPH
jgi:hypothetical protein